MSSARTQVPHDHAWPETQDGDNRVGIAEAILSGAAGIEPSQHDLTLRASQHPDLLAAVGGRSAREVAVVGNDLEACQLEEEPHLAP